jgi:hypothetical protein
MSNTNPIGWQLSNGLFVPVSPTNPLPVTTQTGSTGVVQVADGTTPSQLLKVDTSGRLTLIPNQTFQMIDGVGGVNKQGVDVNGAATITDLIRFMTTQGKAFGAVKAGTTGAAQNVALALFTAAANTKNILLYRIRYSCASGAQFFLNTQTANYALTAVTAYNKDIPSVATTTCTITGSLNAGAVGGTVLDNGLLSGTAFEVLQNNSYIYLPAGTAESIIGYVQQAAAGFSSVLFEWIEY